ncbi:Cholesterol 24-hydroxylase [Acropora cervicornis]|uniref:Cholesterol 24-hydroxylase n=2 Tax=Acropora TaxID=6127 RepID=A0AAD9QI59_ACRCE|nr:Cholesterol 24-hydroxylase [Acropora cervicornis]
MLALSFACLLSLVFMVYSSYLIYVHWTYRHIPGPKRDNFFSGNYPLLQREGKRGKILHEVVEDLRVNYGPVMVIWIYHRPILFVSDPEVARKCLVTLNLPKNSFGAKNFAFPYGQRFVGNGLVTELDHEVWQKHRSLLNPAFHRRYLMNLMTAFNSSCDLFLNKLDEMADGKTVVDMAEEFARVTMDVIGKVAFDVDLDVIIDKNSPFPAALTETLKGVQESFFAPFWQVDLSSISVQKRLSKTTKFLRDYAKKVIQERQEAISRKDDTPSDILNHILFVAKAEPSLTLEYLVDEFVTFFVAGQETTSNQLSFTLYEILKHPYIEDRIVQEIETVLGSCQFVKYNDLGNLLYLGQTLKEGLRLHSPVGGTSRITVKEEDLGGYLVPGNTSVSVSLFVLHHLPEVWPEPKKFDPDRFSPESKISSNALRSAYFPFSFGPRTCIGQTFAQFEAQVLMARLLQEFELTLLEGQNEIQHEQRLTVKPRGGVLCTIKRRGDNQR